MRWRKLSRGRAVILFVAALFGVPAAVMDTIQRFHVIESGLPTWATPYLPVVYLSAFVIGLAALGTAPMEDHDLSGLHGRLAQLEASQRGRRLDGNQQREMIAVLSAIMSDAREWERQHAPDEDPAKILVRLSSIGDDREVLDYRSDFAAVFRASGFEPIVDEWQQGPLEFEAFRRAITVIKGDERNVIRPRVIAALRAANLPVRESEFPFGQQAHKRIPFWQHYSEPAAFLVIGQRT